MKKTTRINKFICLVNVIVKVGPLSINRLAWNGSKNPESQKVLEKIRKVRKDFWGEGHPELEDQECSKD
jgi:hypothetical protein